jgi:translocation and assembly module TamB
VAGLPLAWVELIGGPQLAGSALSGRHGVRRAVERGAGAGAAHRGRPSRGVAGDVTVLAETLDGAAARVNAGVRDARAGWRTQGEQLVLALLWDSERAGPAQGEIRSRLARTPDGGWEWPSRAPLERARAGAAAAHRRLVAAGAARLAAARLADGGHRRSAARRAQPQLSGPVAADDLALRSVVDGIELRNGRLRAQLAGQNFAVSEFLLRDREEGAGGTLSPMARRVDAGGPVFEAHAQLTQLRASIRSDRQLTVSGPVDARMDRCGTTVTASCAWTGPHPDPGRNAAAPGRGRRGAQCPRRATLRGRRPRRRRASEANGRTLTMKVSFDMGDDFRVAGRGLDTRLAGSVEIRGRAAGHAADGRPDPHRRRPLRGLRPAPEHRAGRAALHRAARQPALDILAVRPILTPKVGVQVSGRAQAPHVELYSEAGLSEAETLSYLVLGRSASSGGDRDRAAAARRRRADRGPRRHRQGHRGTLGLDDISVRSDSTAGAVVRVGKRFADNFYAAYERSLEGTMGTLFIFYDVSQRFTLRAEAGERAGIDLIFTFAFDGSAGARRRRCADRFSAVEHQAGGRGVRVQRAVGARQPRLRGRQLAAAVHDLAFGPHALHLGADRAHQVHAQFRRGVGAAAGIIVCTAQPSAESSRWRTSRRARRPWDWRAPGRACPGTRRGPRRLHQPEVQRAHDGRGRQLAAQHGLHHLQPAAPGELAGGHGDPSRRRPAAAPPPRARAPAIPRVGRPFRVLH